MVVRRLIILFVVLLVFVAGKAQELNARITINHDAVGNTKVSVFEALQRQLSELMNSRSWANVPYTERERIECNFLITVATYSETDNSFTASLMLSAVRPVYGSAYTTTFFSTRDADFNFMFQEFDNLEFRPEAIDNNLTAMMAYWAYMIIGLDMDTFAPMGGTEVLQTAAQIVDDSQMLGYPGWRPFDNNRNRHALINDYLDGAMEPYRQMQYDYYRCGLDSMHVNAQAGRERIGQSMQLLQQAHTNKPMSLLPQIFTDFKRDELVNIFSHQGTSAERETIYNILFNINPSQSISWNELKR